MNVCETEKKGERGIEKKQTKRCVKISTKKTKKRPQTNKQTSPLNNIVEMSKCHFFLFENFNTSSKEPPTLGITTDIEI